MAAGYTDWQQGAIDGLKMGWNMRGAYDQAKQGINVSGYNAEVDKYNAGISANFGEDPSLLMSKISGAVATPYNPVVIARNSTGIEHKIDGNNQAGGVRYPQPDASGRVYGMPYDSYLMWGPTENQINAMKSGTDVSPGLGTA
jgi:hypothetical protein